MEILNGLSAAAQLQRCAGLLCAALALLLGAPTRAEDPAPSEYEIKAAFLFNFAKFVEWPQETLRTNDPIRIGVLGRGNFLEDISKTIEGKKIDMHPVRLETYAETVPTDAPHILFVANPTDRRQLRRLLNDLNTRPVLIVGHAEGFCEAGGAINFKREGRKIRFEVNPKAAERHRLKMSSKLIGVALHVVETDSEP
jgi:hypothetical protein